MRFATLSEELRDHGHDDVFQEIEDKKREHKEMWEEKFREYEQKVKTLQKYKADQKSETLAEINAETQRAARLVSFVQQCHPTAFALWARLIQPNS